MGLVLTELTIDNFRGLRDYRITLQPWTILIGPNGTMKSSVVDAALILASASMHKREDLPAWVDPSQIDPKKVSVQVKYLFEITTTLDQELSTPDVRTFLLEHYRKQIAHYENKKYPKDTKNLVIPPLKNSLKELASETPISEILRSSLYQTLKAELGQYPNDPDFAGVSLGNRQFKMPEQIFKLGRYLQVDYTLDFDGGPGLKFALLDNQRNTILGDAAFFHWLKRQKVFHDDMALGVAICALSIKGVSNAYYIDEEFLPDVVLYSTAQNFHQHVRWLMQAKPDVLNAALKGFRKVFGARIELRSVNDRVECRLDGGPWFSSDRLSDGMHRGLEILLQAGELSLGQLLVVDELEQHLHPGAARALQAILGQWQVRILCTSHSGVLLRPEANRTVILHPRKGAVRELATSDLAQALEVLGASGSDLLLFDQIVFVEGPSDPTYLYQWLSAYVDLKGTEDDVDALNSTGFVFLGGDAMTKLDLSTLPKLTRKALFVVDGDKRKNKAFKRFRDRCRRKKVPFLVLSRREIENYIPPAVLEKEFGLAAGVLNYGPQGDVVKELAIARGGIGIKKTDLASRVAPLLGPAHLSSDPKWMEELMGIIQELRKKAKGK